MRAVPRSIDTGQGPPVALPLGHFLVGLGFLLAAGVVGVAGATGRGAAGWTGLARTHLLVLGWVCVTILGAMTQFVPVWSGVRLWSRRLAAAQLWLVVPGVVGLAAGLATGRPGWLPVAGTLVLAGLWVFVANLGATLWTARPLDVTERHFALALGHVALTPLLGLGLGLALGGWRLPAGLTYAGVAAAHATLAVFGVVLTTVVGALYQLVTMFTQVDPDAWDRRLQAVETATFPVGVVVLAGGRLLSVPGGARVGGVLVVVGLLAVAVSVGRRLRAARVEPTPTLARYAVAVVALALWAGVALPAWLRVPLANRLGGPAARPLLLVGVVGAVVLGTLYHAVPFLVWLERYADRLGLEAVPAVEDLYDERLATAHLSLLLAGVAGLVVAGAVGLGSVVEAGAWAAVLGSGAVAAANLGLVVRRHARTSARSLLGVGTSE
jgi:hypothetical protein